MANLQYNLVQGLDGQSNITVVLDGRMLVASSEHPRWEEILKSVLAGEADGLEGKFDLSVAVNNKFSRLSDRVSVKDGVVYLDGDPIDNSLTDQIVRFLNEDVDDWEPLVKFMENVLMNPQEHSREQLYSWLTNNEFSITEDGMILGYKGMQSVGDKDGVYRSTHQGHAIVNGEDVTGYIEQKIGDVVEMPRSEVTFDPYEACSTGLHVSNFDYANSYGDTVLTVEVHPRDVVSVPTHDSFQKVRACRYTVLDVVEKPFTSALVQQTGFVTSEAPSVGTLNADHFTWTTLATVEHDASSDDDSWLYADDDEEDSWGL